MLARMLSCKLCSFSIEKKNNRAESIALVAHIKTVHQLSRAEYEVKTAYDGTWPICKHEDCSNAAIFIGPSPNKLCHQHEEQRKFLQEKIVVQCSSCSSDIKRTRRAVLKCKFFFCDRKCQNDAKKIGHPYYDDIVQKRDRTNLEKHGVINAFQRSDVKEIIRALSMEKWGVPYPMQSSKYFNDWRIHFVEVHGYDHPMRDPEIKSRIDWSEKASRAHETKKKNKSFKKSKFEDRIVRLLEAKFVVERQKRLPEFPRAWAIDAFLPEIDLFVQIDGSYWHGLDRPIDVIKQFKSKQDVIIYKKYMTDQEQKSWFEDKKLNLLRVLDTQFQKLDDYEAQKLLFELIEGMLSVRVSGEKCDVRGSTNLKRENGCVSCIDCSSSRCG